MIYPSYSSRASLLQETSWHLLLLSLSFSLLGGWDWSTWVYLVGPFFERSEAAFLVPLLFRRTRPLLGTGSTTGGSSTTGSSTAGSSTWSESPTTGIHEVVRNLFNRSQATKFPHHPKPFRNQIRHVGLSMFVLFVLSPSHRLIQNRLHRCQSHPARRRNGPRRADRWPSPCCRATGVRPDHLKSGRWTRWFLYMMRVLQKITTNHSHQCLRKHPLWPFVQHLLKGQIPQRTGMNMNEQGNPKVIEDSGLIETPHSDHGKDSFVKIPIGRALARCKICWSLHQFSNDPMVNNS